MISFVGAGPGDPELITVAGAKRLAAAEIVIWASSLVPEALLQYCQNEPQRYDSAAMTLEDVVAIYRANTAKSIVRLHSGDPSVYGAIQEQIDECLRHSLEFEIVPGVTSVAATAARIGRELTIPKVSQSVVFTRLASKTSASMPERETLQAYARIGGSIGIFLSAASPAGLQEALLCEGSAFNESTPAVIAIRTSWPDERIVASTVGTLAADLRATKAKRTVRVLVGEALAGEAARSHLYRPDFSHKFRKRSLAGSTSGRPSKATTAKL